MERLTIRNFQGTAVYKGFYDCERCGESIFRLPDLGNGSPTDKLCEYEELEEQGLLLKLPCKVGDTVYSVVEDGLQIIELEFSLDFYARRKSDFGKTVFLTYQEAELELANKLQSHAEAIMDERKGR